MHYLARTSGVSNYYWTLCGTIVHADKRDEYTKDPNKIRCGKCKSRIREEVNSAIQEEFDAAQNY